MYVLALADFLAWTLGDLKKKRSPLLAETATVFFDGEQLFCVCHEADTEAEVAADAAGAREEIAAMEEHAERGVAVV